ncbi:MAG: hypothetical protein NVSMB47_13280 [Polyangiales bacterium]
MLGLTLPTLGCAYDVDTFALDDDAAASSSTDAPPPVRSADDAGPRDDSAAPPDRDGHPKGHGKADD